VEKHRGIGRFDSVSIAGMAVFGALAILLSIISQALGLYFVPPVNYLQFDFGEVAIFLSLFVFGPIPAIVSALVEFLGLMLYGKSVPIGPLFKVIAELVSLLGIWLGSIIISKMQNRRTLTTALGLGTVFGIGLRVTVMTIPNYILVTAFFPAGTIPLVLGLTALFNFLQFLLAMGLSSLVIASPQVRNAKAAGRSPWIISLMQANPRKTEDVSLPSSSEGSEARP
jgi:riboflavin transporter FmnP